jgi:hypothetical protein
MIFVSRTVVNIRNQPSLAGQVVGQVGANQDIPTEGNPVQADGFQWRQVAPANSGLWVAERRADNRVVLLNPKMPAAAAPVAPLPTPPTNPTRPTTSTPPSNPAPSLPTIPANVDLDPKDYTRTFRAALAITRAFEGGGFASYNNYDRGIISYGIMQFTLSSGSLIKVLDRYLQASTSATAQSLRSEFAARYRAKDQALREDGRFKDLLSAAAQESAMQEAQFAIATSDYWDVVLRNYVQRRGNMRLPLSYALLFDMGINFGVNHSFVRRAEESLGVPSNSRIGTNGVSEQQLFIRVAELRRDSHYAQAERENLPGLKVRADFWIAITTGGDWFLQGDDKGFVYPKRGVSVQVRQPV